MLTHQNRLERCIAGEKPDRVPVALWRHFPVEDQSPNLLAKAVIDFQNLFDFDFVKVTPSSSFCVKDWGTKDIWKGNPEGSREYVEGPIKTPEDWFTIKVLNSNTGSLSEQLECIKLIKANLPKGTPIIQTIFNPLSQAKNLVGKTNLISQIRLYPDAVKAGLKVITETTIEFTKKVLSLGIDGIFFAVQHAQADLLSPVEFDDYLLPFDVEILEAAKPSWLNVAHLHGTNVYFSKVTQYPVNVINWHDRETSPTLQEGKKVFSGAVCGGLRQWETLVNGNPDLVRKEAIEAITNTESKRFILGTGCVLPITAPYSNIMAVREVVENI